LFTIIVLQHLFYAVMSTYIFRDMICVMPVLINWLSDTCRTNDDVNSQLQSHPTTEPQLLLR